ncbi:hypothetical protein FRC12_010454 [Ceratobasidium sp. 428]|nr:hypothetical protein FRC12_010454 [Ceratobasidium sp. 428]
MYSLGQNLPTVGLGSQEPSSPTFLLANTGNPFISSSRGLPERKGTNKRKLTLLANLLQELTREDEQEKERDIHYDREC